MTGEGLPAPSALRRMRARQELQLAAALAHADRPMAAGWWSLLALRYAELYRIQARAYR
jgi:hypothetical protein